jgi:hypothetical protein
MIFLKTCILEGVIYLIIFLQKRNGDGCMYYTWPVTVAAFLSETVNSVGYGKISEHFRFSLSTHPQAVLNKFEIC